MKKLLAFAFIIVSFLLSGCSQKLSYVYNSTKADTQNSKTNYSKTNYSKAPATANATNRPPINTFPSSRCDNGNCPTVPLPANPYKNKTCELVNPYSFRQCGGCSTCIMKIEVNGLGATPVNALTSAQAKLMARRAAILEGYKALTERLYGIKINGRDTVKNMILQNSTLRAYVEGLIRGAKIEEEEYKDGIYKVVMSLKFDVADWNEFLKNAGYYIGYYDYY